MPVRLSRVRRPHPRLGQSRGYAPKQAALTVLNLISLELTWAPKPDAGSAASGQAMTLAQRLALLKGNKHNPNADGTADGRTDTECDEADDGGIRAAPLPAPASATVPLVARLQRLYPHGGATVRAIHLADKTKPQRQ